MHRPVRAERFSANCVSVYQTHRFDGLSNPGLSLQGEGRLHLFSAYLAITGSFNNFRGYSLASP